MTGAEDVNVSVPNSNLYMGGVFSGENSGDSNAVHAHVLKRAEEQYLSTSPETLTRIAAMWTTLRGELFTATDVTLMLAALSLAELSSAPGNDDAWVDLAGFAALGCRAENDAR